MALAAASRGVSATAQASEGRERRTGMDISWRTMRKDCGASIKTAIDAYTESGAGRSAGQYWRKCGSAPPGEGAPSALVELLADAIKPFEHQVLVMLERNGQTRR